MTPVRAFATAFPALLAGLAASAGAQTPAAPAPAAPATPPPPACESAEHRQFDFWVGRWDVYPSGRVSFAVSTIASPSRAPTYSR